MTSGFIGFAPSTPIQSVFNQTLSKKGPMVVPYYVDMQTSSSVEVDLTALVNNGNIDFISGAWIDNTSNDEILVIQVAGSNQIVDFPPKSQGYIPLLANDQPKFNFSSANVPGEIIPIFFYNAPMIPYIWNSEGGSTVIGDWLTDTELRASPIEVDIVSSSSTGVVISDYSLTLAGGDEEIVAPGDAANYLLIYNPVGNSNVTINIAGGDADASGFTLIGGGSYENDVGITGAINASGTASDDLIVYAG